MSFDGSEFYFNQWPELYGQKFGSLTCRFDDAIVMGIKVGFSSLLFLLLFWREGSLVRVAHVPLR